MTIQTFPYVLRAIENSISLKQRRYAIIADEAHSSKTGSTARQLKEVLMIDAQRVMKKKSPQKIFWMRRLPRDMHPVMSVIWPLPLHQKQNAGFVWAFAESG